MMHGDHLNKGTLTTLRYLIDTEDKETRAAMAVDYIYMHYKVAEYDSRK